MSDDNTIESLNITNNHLSNDDNIDDNLPKQTKGKKQTKEKKNKDDSNLKKTTIEEIDEDFKDMIFSWVALDEKIKEINNDLKDIKDEKKQFENYILEYMEKQRDDVIMTNKGAITRNVKDSKSAITPEIIQETLSKILKDKDTAYVCTNEILSRRTIKQSSNLKRQKIKTNNNKIKKNKNNEKNNN